MDISVFLSGLCLCLSLWFSLLLPPRNQGLGVALCFLVFLWLLGDAVDGLVALVVVVLEPPPKMDDSSEGSFWMRDGNSLENCRCCRLLLLL